MKRRKWMPPVAACLLLAWGAHPYFPGQIDDAYIVFAYAHRIVEYGEAAWNTGSRVEGYSSPVHLALMVLGVAAGVDASVFAKVVSFVAAIVTLLWLARPFFGESRAWLVFLTAAWQPFQHWSVAAMETSLATLIAVIGWPLLFAGVGAWSMGCIVLMAFSLARPEGVAWLLLGLAMRFRYSFSWGKPERTVLAALAILGVYHLIRVAYFGAVFPTPWLVKIVAIDGWNRGLRELASELLSAAPLLAIPVLFRTSIQPAVWIPVLLQGALLVRADGDWMGHARLLLPAAVASAAAAMATPSLRRPPWWTSALVLPFAAAALLWEPARTQTGSSGWRDVPSLRLWESVRASSTPPLFGEVAFLVGRIPSGAGVQMSDVGLPGNLHDIRVWDGAGLTDRPVAEVIAGGTPGMTETLRERYSVPETIWCLRYGVAPDGGDPADAWLEEMFPEVATTPDASGLFWRCREGGHPSRTTVLERWRLLLKRFPLQDEIRLRYARELLTEGQVDTALAVSREAVMVGERTDGWLAFAAADAQHVAGRGWPRYTNGTLQSASFPSTFWSDHLLHVDVDDPGRDGAIVLVTWAPPCGETRRFVVREESTLPVPECDSPGARSLVVEFANDDWRPPLDRNLFVTLEASREP